MIYEWHKITFNEESVELSELLVAQQVPLKSHPSGGDFMIRFHSPEVLHKFSGSY